MERRFRRRSRRRRPRSSTARLRPQEDYGNAIVAAALAVSGVATAMLSLDRDVDFLISATELRVRLVWNQGQFG
jgi:hypothetical protein